MKDRWVSPSTKLESKEQLKAYRTQKWKGLLMQNGLDWQRAKWWTPTEDALELTLWDAADVEYEERKKNLKAQIGELSDKKKKDYFKDIGLDENTDVDEWLNIK